MDYYLLIVAFFFIAMIYSSVGFGGGSSYLALMGTLALGFTVFRPIALLCNIVVVTSGTIIFFRAGKINFRKVWPFIAMSVPMAFIGGYYPIRERTFFIILGITLIVAALLLWFQKAIEEMKTTWRSDNTPLNIALGGGIGLLSGVVSIGGGIFLSPVLHLMKWDEAKRISALASFFILVNSISGLAGQISQQADFDWSTTWPLLLAVFAGGQIGSRLGAQRFNPITIKRVTAAVILAAGINILRTHI
ncbi:MAG: sulfite exporter TauE/SafE family protein [Bacteroidia bacterium]|nr:sulfite exporter TauE/SafE family protein [Bacteroidia bacterium]